MAHRRLRVLHVMRRASGGTVSHVCALAAALASLGVPCAVAAPGPTLHRLAQRLGSRAPSPAIPLIPLPLGDGVRPVADAAAAVALRRLARRLEPDVVHAHGHKAAWTAAAAVREGGPALVATVHNFLPGSRWAAWCRAERLVAGWALRRAHRVIAVSRTLAEFASGVMRDGAAGVRVVRNALDQAWSAAGARVSRDARPVPGRGRAVVACVARLHRARGVDALVEAASRLPAELEVEVLIAGDGPQLPVLQARARALGAAGRIRWLGWQPPEPVWARADVAVLPWLREGSSYAALEAMAAGVPVVAFDCPGAREVLGGGGGVLVAEPSPAALAAAVEGLVRDPARRRALGEAARRLVSARTAREMAQETLAVYREAVEAASGRTVSSAARGGTPG